jgi:serine/threonine protein kinase
LLSNTKTEDEISLDDKENNLQENYSIEKKIGQGGQATVYLVKEKSSGKPFALKKFSPTPLSGVNKTLGEVFKFC